MPSILILSFVEWSGAFQRPQHMAVEFARRGWRVAYVSPDYLHRRAQQVASGILPPENLRVLSPPALPGARLLPPVAWANARMMESRIGRETRGDWDVVVFNDPRLAALAARIPARRRVWDHMDDLSAEVNGDGRYARMEADARAAASRIWTGTASLADKHAAAGEVARFIACGVEGERFAAPGEPPPETFAHPLAGYFGAVNERLRPDLLEALLGEGWNVLLIGPGSTQTPKLPQHPRLQWIGPRAYSQLPSYLAQMDLALIPYDFEGPHRFLYPVKALEYLAGGKPVLSTPLPDVVRFLKDYLLIEGGASGWARVAREWPSLRAEAQRRAAAGQAYALARTWGAMADEMIEDLEAR